MALIDRLIWDYGFEKQHKQLVAGLLIFTVSYAALSALVQFAGVESFGTAVLWLFLLGVAVGSLAVAVYLLWTLEYNEQVTTAVWSTVAFLIILVPLNVHLGSTGVAWPCQVAVSTSVLLIIVVSGAGCFITKIRAFMRNPPGGSGGRRSRSPEEQVLTKQELREGGFVEPEDGDSAERDKFLLDGSCEAIPTPERASTQVAG